MDAHDTIEQILKFAVAKEESSVRFYRELSARVKKAETTAVLEILARQEEKHIESLKLELLKQGCTLNTAPTTEADDSAAGVPIELDEKAEAMSYTDALRLGIKKERAAFKLYAELMVIVNEPESRQTYLELAEEEMRHVIQLERELETVSQSHRDI